jgi:hypothetical protein
MKILRKPPPAERRPKRRVSTLLPGVVASLDGSAEHDCTIRDATSSGARIAARTRTLPDEFYLIHIKERTAYRAKVAWRSQAELGLRFVAAMPLSGPLDAKVSFLRKLWLTRAVR